MRDVRGRQDLRRPHAVAGPRPGLGGGGDRRGQAGRAAATRRPPTRRRSTPCAPSSTCSTSRASWSSARASATRRRCSTSARRSAPATARRVDIALDPLEGTTLTAKDMPNALAVIAMGPRGSMLHAPDVYMDKLAIGPGYRTGLVNLDMTPTERIQRAGPRQGHRRQRDHGLRARAAAARGADRRDPRHRRPHPADHRRRRRRRHPLRRDRRRPASTCTWARAARPRACWRRRR